MRCQREQRVLQLLVAPQKGRRAKRLDPPPGARPEGVTGASCPPPCAVGQVAGACALSDSGQSGRAVFRVHPASCDSPETRMPSMWKLMGGLSTLLVPGGHLSPPTGLRELRGPVSLLFSKLTYCCPHLEAIESYSRRILN